MAVCLAHRVEGFGVVTGVRYTAAVVGGTDVRIRRGSTCRMVAEDAEDMEEIGEEFGTSGAVLEDLSWRVGESPTTNATSMQESVAI